MKKTYIKPTTNIVKIKMPAILNGSPVGMSGESQDNNVALGRRARFSDWEEEDCE